LKEKHGITALDIVVANAGISKVFPPVSELNIKDIQEHFDVNLYGVIRLFQAVLPLLNQAKAPKFVTLGTSAASLGEMASRNFPNSAYGTSKVALNYITLKIHFENPKVTAFPLDPG
jgi:norsolorinic acid ketoreductase